MGIISHTEIYSWHKSIYRKVPCGIGTFNSRAGQSRQPRTGGTNLGLTSGAMNRNWYYLRYCMADMKIVKAIYQGIINKSMCIFCNSIKFHQ